MTKVLLFGANGFIGRVIRKDLSKDYDVIAGVRSGVIAQNEVSVDLLDPQTIKDIISNVQPDVIINAAGIIDPQADTMQNVVFTKNILGAVLASNIVIKRIIIFGSAGEYGRIQPNELPVSEDVTLRADTGYGLAKKLEEQEALSFREKGLAVVVVRIFNPIGVGMAEKFLVPRIKQQIEQYVAKERGTLEVSRKDSKRDYIAVDDIASAIRVLIEGDPKHDVYNIGSGVATSNGDLLQLMINSSKMDGEPKVIETSAEPEPLVASQADITRIKQEFHWEPRHNIADIVEEIMNDQ